MDRNRDNIKNIDLNSSSEGGSLLKRKLGEKIFLNLRKELRAVPNGGILSLDFRRVKFATASCLGEILRIFDEMKRSEFEGIFFLLRVNLKNEELVDCLNYVVKHRGTVIPVLDENNNWRLIGDLSKALRDTLELMEEKHTITSTEVSRHFEIPLSAASNRLKQLYGMKLIKREEETKSESGGRQYIYNPITL